MSFFQDFLFPVIIGIIVIHLIFESIAYLNNHLFNKYNIDNKNQINITIKHAGNQGIYEFSDKDGNYKNVYITFDKTKTVGDLKHELTKHIQFSTVDSIRLRTAPFGKEIKNDVVVDWVRKNKNKNKLKNEEFCLYIVIDSY
jgi:hypothetical protein